MKRYTMLASALLLGTMLAAGAASAKTLVYCSEGAPKTSLRRSTPPAPAFDAARPVYNQLVEFERGTTNVDARPRREAGKFRADGMTITFNLRKGVKFHSDVEGFTPTRDFNADDVLFSFERQWKADHPYAQGFRRRL